MKAIREYAQLPRYHSDVIDSVRNSKHLTGKSSPLVYRKLPRIEASDLCKQLDVLVKIVAAATYHAKLVRHDANCL